MSVPTIACVLRSGGEYGPEWVWALRRGLNRHLDVPYRFVCLSDVVGIGQWRVPLKHDWRGWWSKMELFDPANGLTGTVLYLDLDTIVTGDLSDMLAYDGDLAMLSDFYRPHLAQSGVMAYQAGSGTYAAELFEAFAGGPPQRWMRKFRGDGEWLNAHADSPDRLQDLYPGQVVSLKVHARLGPPDNARLVCAHGVPKMHDPAAGWAHREWQSVPFKADAA